MFLGHFAVGFALKQVAPRTSLGILVAAPQLLDFLWPLFLLAGLEHVRIDPGNTAFTPLAFDSYPWSHSLVMAVVWAIAFGGAYWQWARPPRGSRVGVWLAAAVMSHWGLDWVTHRPDLPLTPWSPQRVGLGLWNSVAATIALEATMYGAALWVYARSAPSRRPAGRVHLWVFATVLSLIYAANLLGPPPPDEQSLAYVAAGLWVFAVWAWWVDRARAHA